MKKRILALILSLTMIFTTSAVNLSVAAQATETNCDLFLHVFLDSLESNGVIKTDYYYLEDGGFSVFPDKSTLLTYRVVVGAQNYCEDVIVKEVTCYYDSSLKIVESDDYDIEITGSAIIGDVTYNKLAITNISLPYESMRAEIYLKFETPLGYTNIFKNFYSEISKGDSNYIDEDSTPGNALNNGVFDSTGEDDAGAFLNEDNLIACPYGLKYEINNSSVKITDYIGGISLDTLYIPSSINGYPVTDIGDSAFMDSTSLFDTIFIPSSVVNIWPGAFQNYTDNAETGTPSVKNIVISEGVQWIGARAFYNCCDLKTINIPSTVSTIKGSKISSYTFNCSFLSRGLYMYSELPNPSLQKIEVSKGSYADSFLSGITNTNDFDTPTFSELLTYGNKVYTVHYDHSYNGGDSSIVETRPAYSGDAVDFTLTANKNGSKFIGWNTDPSATKGLSSLKMGNSDIVLYAIFEKTLSSISIESNPTKITYEVGESLNTSGLKLKLTYSDGTYETITSGFTTSGFSSATAGTKTVTVKYGDLTTTFTVAVEVSKDTPQIMVESKKNVAGRTFTVDVILKNNPGIASARLTLDFDTSVLTLVDVVDAGKLGVQCHKAELTSPYVLSWMNDTATENFDYNGTIVTLTFEIAGGTELGDYVIDLFYDYDNYDIWNVNVERVKFVAVDGVISVIDTIIGDVNSDGAVNTLDRMTLARHLANWEGYTSKEIDMVAADVNGDGVVNTLDRMALARHLAHWSGYETLPCII